MTTGPWALAVSPDPQCTPVGDTLLQGGPDSCCIRPSGPGAAGDQPEEPESGKEGAQLTSYSSQRARPLFLGPHSLRRHM